MQTLPPIQMPGKSKDAPSTGVKLATHALAVFLGAAGGVGGSIATQQAPPRQEQPMADYQSRLDSAWAQERTSSHAATDLRRLLFMYRATILAIEMGEMRTLAELSKAAKEQEGALSMATRLPLLRAVVTAEWTAQIGGPSADPITPGMRVDISVFMRQTVSWLERLPK